MYSLWRPRSLRKSRYWNWKSLAKKCLNAGFSGRNEGFLGIFRALEFLKFFLEFITVLCIRLQLRIRILLNFIHSPPQILLNDPAPYIHKKICPTPLLLAPVAGMPMSRGLRPLIYIVVGHWLQLPTFSWCGPLSVDQRAANYRSVSADDPWDVILLYLRQSYDLSAWNTYLC